MLARYLKLLVLCGLIGGCTTTEPVPELVAAARMSPETPATIEGELLQTCVGKTKFHRNITLANQGHYDPGLTYKFAESLVRGIGKDSSDYAPFVRAYSVRISGTALFDVKVNSRFVCYYELRQDRLRYLTGILTGADYNARKSEFGLALQQAYATMSGKSLLRVYFGG